MITLYANGLPVGSGPEFAQLIAGLADRKEIVEFRDETGKKFGHYYPPEPICPWDPTLTREQLDREDLEDDEYTLEEILKELGAP
jgi:hypothetical protein